jgi:hypothetical protein
VLPDHIEVMTLFVPDIAEGRVALLNGWLDQPWAAALPRLIRQTSSGESRR